MLLNPAKRLSAPARRRVPPPEPLQVDPEYLADVREVRLVMSFISLALEMLRDGGIAAECLREDADNCVKLTIRIPRIPAG